jgi:hypothetical protein
MSIAWDTIRPALLSLFGDLSGLQSVWKDKRRPFVDPRLQAVLLVHVRQVTGIGVDDRRYVDLALPIPQATLEENVAGHRRVTLELRVESFRHDDDRFAFNAAETLRTKLFFGASLARMRAVEVALVRVGDVLDLSGIVQDDRITSIAVLELVTTIAMCTANAGAANNVFSIETVENPVDHPSTVFNPP